MAFYHHINDFCYNIRLNTQHIKENTLHIMKGYVSYIVRITLYKEIIT